MIERMQTFRSVVPKGTCGPPREMFIIVRAPMVEHQLDSIFILNLL